MERYAYRAPDDFRPESAFDFHKLANRPWMGITAFVGGRPHLVIDYDGREYHLEDVEANRIRLASFVWDDDNYSYDNALVAASRAEGSPLRTAELSYDEATGQWAIADANGDSVSLTQLIEQLEAGGWEPEEAVECSEEEFNDIAASVIDQIFDPKFDRSVVTASFAVSRVIRLSDYQSNLPDRIQVMHFGRFPFIFFPGRDIVVIGAEASDHEQLRDVIEDRGLEGIDVTEQQVWGSVIPKPLNDINTGTKIPRGLHMETALEPVYASILQQQTGMPVFDHKMQRLANDPGEGTSDRGDEVDGPLACPRCGSHTCEVAPNADGPSKVTCKACGHQFSKDLIVNTSLKTATCDCCDACPGCDCESCSCKEAKTAKTATDTEGSPLSIGRVYQLYSTKYKLPDLIRIVDMSDREIVAAVEDDPNYLHEIRITAEDVTKEGYSFEPWIVESSKDEIIESHFVVEARKKHSPSEQRALIEESGTARNKEKLRLEDTHYVTEASTDDDDEVVFWW